VIYRPSKDTSRTYRKGELHNVIALKRSLLWSCQNF